MKLPHIVFYAAVTDLINPSTLLLTTLFRELPHPVGNDPLVWRAAHSDDLS